MQQKLARRHLDSAKKALAAGNLARCQKIVARIGVSSSVKDDISVANAQFVKDFNSKDAAAVASHYTQDAAAFPPDQARANGRENIQKMWQGAMDAGVTDLALTSTEVEQSGKLALETGSFSLKVPGKDGKPMDVNGKYVVAWKKARDGSWLLFRDIWNADQPMTAQ